jgi:heterogeneous nuclear ribonucleoprotein A1/A3
MVFDGCELQCRRAHRVNKRKHDAAAHADTGGRSNDGAVAASSPAVQKKDLASTSEMPKLSSNPPVAMTPKGSSSPIAPARFRRNAAAGGAGILGVSPAAAAMSSSSSGQNVGLNNNG